MIVFINFGGGRGWWMGPLLGIGLSLVSSLVQDLLAARWYAAPAPAPRGRPGYVDLDEPRGGAIGGRRIVLDALDVILLLLLAGLALKAVQLVRSRGGLRAMLDQQQRRQQAQHAQRRRAAAAARERPDFDRVVAALQRLPTEAVATREQLERESVHELKARLAAAGAEAAGAVEKGELVARVLEAWAGSSGESCAICAEEYVPGDVVRVLPCRHRMHLECVDRWLLKSTEHSAPKGCPLCNDASWLQPARG